MKKTILTVMCVTLVAAFAAGCATNQPAGAGAASDTESVATDDQLGMIEVPVESEEQSEAASDVISETQASDDNTDIQASDAKTTKGYKDEYLLAWASKYYEFCSGQSTPKIEIDHVDGDMVHIHIYEDIEPAKEGESDPGHRTTLEWYVVDRKTGKGTNFAGEEVDLTSMYKRTTSIEQSIEDSKKWEEE